MIVRCRWRSMATLAAYVEERRPRPGQAVVISPEFIVEYLQDSLSRGRVILEDGTKTSSPFKLAERWSAARRDCANRPGNHSNPAESLLVLKWVDDHVSRCFLLGFKPQGASCTLRGFCTLKRLRSLSYASSSAMVRGQRLCGPVSCKQVLVRACAVCIAFTLILPDHKHGADLQPPTLCHSTKLV